MLAQRARRLAVVAFDGRRAAAHAANKRRVSRLQSTAREVDQGPTFAHAPPTAQAPPPAPHGGVLPATIDARRRSPASDTLFLSLSALAGELRLALSAPAPHSDAVVANVNALLERATLNPREWEAFANFETHRYTRNVVAVDPAFVVLLLCWDSGQSSAIHDHSGSSCWVKVLSGALDEQRFAAGTMEPLGASERAEAGAVTYMHDSRGLHAISNASSRRAVSLHVYSPRFESCRIFRPNTGEASSVSMVAALAPALTDARNDAALTLRGLAQALHASAQASRRNVVDVGDVGDAEMEALLQRVAPTASEWAEYAAGACFSEFGVQRHLAHVCDKFSVTVMCWRAGQAETWLADAPQSGEASKRRSWLRVLHGALHVETRCGTVAVDSTVPGDDAVLSEDTQSRATDRRVSNAADDAVAVSVHVHSPPLTQAHLKGGRGAPVCVHADVASAGDAGYGGAAARTPLGAAVERGNVVYSTLDGLGRLLDGEFARPGAPPALEILSLLNNVRLHPLEWRRCAAWGAKSFTRVLLEQTADYNLVLTCWDRGHFSPVHDHAGSASWTKVLEGTLGEAVYDVGEGGLSLSRSCSHAADSAHYAGPGTVHGCENVDEEARCFTLTLYSPPYVRANAYTPDGRSVEIPTHVWGNTHYTEGEAIELRRPETAP